MFINYVYIIKSCPLKLSELTFEVEFHPETKTDDVDDCCFVNKPIYLFILFIYNLYLTR